MQALTVNSTTNVVPHRGGALFAARPIQKAVSPFVFSDKITTFEPNEELFGEGERADHVYKIVKGMVRTYSSLVCGRRMIESFRVRGDIFGFEADSEREFSAEAIDEVYVVVAPRTAVIGPAIDRLTAQELWTVTARELRRVQQHALLLAKNAQQRVAFFFLEMSQRLGTPDVLELPMTRQDIADYLGLTIETVSRIITQFETRNLVSLPKPRQIMIRDPIALKRINE